MNELKKKEIIDLRKKVISEEFDNLNIKSVKTYSDHHVQLIIAFLKDGKSPAGWFIKKGENVTVGRCLPNLQDENGKWSCRFIKDGNVFDLNSDSSSYIDFTPPIPKEFLMEFIGMALDLNL